MKRSTSTVSCFNSITSGSNELINPVLSDLPPKRPASAYNLYYQLERQHILRELDDGEGDKSRGRDPYKKEDIDEFLAHKGSYNSDSTREKRKHVKTHGKISFVELAREAARRWKVLPDSQRNLFHSYFDGEMRKYRLELQRWKKQRRSNKTKDQKKRLALEQRYKEIEGKSQGKRFPSAFGSKGYFMNTNDIDYGIKTCPPPLLASASSNFSAWPLQEFDNGVCISDLTFSERACGSSPSSDYLDHSSLEFKQMISSDRLSNPRDNSSCTFVPQGNLNFTRSGQTNEDELHKQLVEMRMKLHEQAQILSQIKVHSLLNETLDSSIVRDLIPLEEAPFEGIKGKHIDRCVDERNFLPTDTENGFVMDKKKIHNNGLSRYVSDENNFQAPVYVQSPTMIGNFNLGNYEGYNNIVPKKLSSMLGNSENVSTGRDNLELSREHIQRELQAIGLSLSKDYPMASSEFDWDVEKNTGIDEVDANNWDLHFLTE